MMTRSVICSFGVLTMVLIAGCGDPTMGEVSGTVTLDGSPLSEATVTFQPLNGDRMSQAMTDSSGYYELQYSSQTSGAKIGEHKVSISTFQAMTYTDDPENPYGPPAPERVPAEYNVESKLTATVEGGSNVYDWDLKAGSAIFQPDADHGDLGESADEEVGDDG